VPEGVTEAMETEGPERVIKQDPVAGTGTGTRGENDYC
jgi:hypothetical protein